MISPEQHHRLDRLAIAVVGAAVLMNFFLAAVNTHIAKMSSTSVILIQLTLTAIALSLLLIRHPRATATYYLLLSTLLWLALASTFFHEIYPRFFYDILVIPIFTLLGSSVRNVDIKWLRRLVWIVLTIAAIEAIWPSVYIQLLNPLSYYISTRDWVAATNTPAALSDAGLYVGAKRPGGDIFGIAQHRVGSIFLEPLSSGYFSIIAALSFLYFYNFKFRTTALPLAACLILALLSDTRSATAILIALVAFGGLLRYIPRYLGLWVPIAIITTIGAIYLSASTYDRELSYRIGITFSALQDADLVEIMFGGIDTQRAGDSGLVALIGNAGILGALIYFYVASGLVLGNKRMIGLSVSIMIFLVSTAFFGGAFFSIKTGALLGFIVGAFSVGAITNGVPSTRTRHLATISRTKDVRSPRVSA